MREAVSHWVLMHEHPFSIVEEEGFNFMMGITNPQFERITCKALINDCMVVYENEKRKLKGINKINLTTDLWKSGSQKIEYMVITGHFINSNWKLHKRVLSFVHIPLLDEVLTLQMGCISASRNGGLRTKFIQ